MPVNRIFRLSAVAVLAVAGVAGAADAQERPRQVAQAPAAPAVLATGQDTNDPDLRCDILEVKRVSGGALSIRWRMVNTAGAGAGGLTGGGAAKPITYGYHWVEVYYIDPAENKKYTVITDPSGQHVAGIWEGDLALGQQRLSWAKFAAPPASSTKISFTISEFAPFEDLPISP
jgi:hypothetical protein